MADQRQCEDTTAHDFHGWSSIGARGHLYFVCEGVAEPHPYTHDGCYRSGDFPRCHCGLPAFEAVHSGGSSDV